MHKSRRFARCFALSVATLSLLFLTACPDEENGTDAGTTTPDTGGGGGDMGVTDNGGPVDMGMPPPDSGVPDTGMNQMDATPQAIIFLHTNDEHSHELGFGPEIDDFPMPAATTNTEIVGGLKRRAKVLAQLRDEASVARVPAVTVGAGDLMMGSLFHVANAIGGVDYAIAGAALNYDVLTLGNHEFDFGVGALTTALRTGGINLAGTPGIVRIPIVTSNIHFSMSSDSDNLLAQLYTTDPSVQGHPLRRFHVATYGTGASQVKVGFVGVMGLDAALVAPFKSPVKFSLARTNTACTMDSECPGSVCLPPSDDPTAMAGQCAVPNAENDFATHFPAMVKDIADTVALLRGMDVDLVVAVSHAGVNERELAALEMMGMGPELSMNSEEIVLSHGVDAALAANGLKGIDLIVGGHTHTELHAPLDIPHASGNHTFIVQAGEYGKFVGKVRLDRPSASDPWTLDTTYSSLVKIDATIEPTGLPIITEMVIDTILTTVITGLETSVASAPNDGTIYPGEQCDKDANNDPILPNMGNCSPIVPGATGGPLSCVTQAMPCEDAQHNALHTCNPGDRQLDLSGCTFMHASCGNDSIEGDEMCDGTSLNGESCETLGYESGMLACHPNCAYDFSGCVSYFPSLAEIAVNFGRLGFPIKDDPAMLGDLFFYQVGSTDFDVPRPAAFHESNLMNLVTDAARDTINQLDTQSQVDPVRVVINANGVLRDAIQRGATGALSTEDLFRVVPLGVSPVENTPGYPLIDFYASAPELKSALEVGVNQGLLSDSFWLGFSGARVEYDLSLPAFDPADPLNTGRITKVDLIDPNAAPYDDTLLADEESVYDAALGPGIMGYPNPMRLIHIATNLYIGIFAEQLGVCPRLQNGAQLDECKSCMGDGDCTATAPTCGSAGHCTGGSPAAFRVRSLTPIGRFGLFQEIKEFLALTYYISNLGKGGGNLPTQYNGAIPRRMCCVGAACDPERVCP